MLVMGMAIIVLLFIFIIIMLVMFKKWMGIQIAAINSLFAEANKVMKEAVNLIKEKEDG